MQVVNAMRGFNRIVSACVALLLAFALGFIVSARDGAYHEYYPRAGIVDFIDRAQDEVYVVDGTGNLWTFYGVEDWEVGDGIAMIFDDAGTAGISDDIIVSARFSPLEW